MLPRRLALWRLPAHGLGDNILISAVAREIHEVDPSVRITVVARYGELFAGNPHVAEFRSELPAVWSGRLARRAIQRWPIGSHYYMGYELHPGCAHLIAQMCRRVLGADYQPQLAVACYLDGAELLAAQALVPPGSFVTIHSQGKTVYTMNKEWDPERFQQVRNAFPQVPFVQVGLATDVPLARCHDLRGRLTLRQLAAVLKLARLNVCLEGGLMHLAAAVGTRSVVVYGGFTHPSATGYPGDAHLVNQPPCSPCAPQTGCPHNHRCMADITAAHVIAAVERALASSQPSAAKLSA